MPLFKKEVHSAIYIYSLFVLAASIPLSPFMMSAAQFALLFNWIAEGNLRDKLHKLRENKPALVFLLIYFIHIFGLFYTYDFGFALDDLRIKIPLLVLPVIMATTPLISRRDFIKILLIHVAASFAGTLFGLGIYYIFPVKDMREISILISHIRFSLNICLDIFILVFFILTKNDFKLTHKLGFGALIIWFIYFLLFMESFTGIIILSVVSGILLVVYILKKSRSLYRLLFFAFLIMASVIMFFYLKNIYSSYHKNLETINPEKLESFTKYGGFYVHDTNSKLTDNGHYTWMYVCDEELRSSWNKRSRIQFDSADKQKHPIRFTLIRFLTSKGLRKDMDAVNSLSDKEISLIENGVANAEYAELGSFENRMKSAIWEYEDYKLTGDPRGRSMIQRIELWRSSVQLIKNYPLLGVGTGDPANVFAASLIVKNSLLKNSNLRSHNQFLTFAIAFGCLGLFIFFFALIYPAIKLRKFSDFLYLSFFLIAFFSMISEDTLETQAGVTFFAFFSCLYLFADKKTDTA